jgi:hypothetical protein
MALAARGGVNLKPKNARGGTFPELSLLNAILVKQ